MEDRRIDAGGRLTTLQALQHDALRRERAEAQQQVRLFLADLTAYDRYCLRLLMRGAIGGNGDAIRHLKSKGFLSGGPRDLTDKGKKAIGLLDENARKKPGGRASNAIYAASAAAVVGESEEPERVK